MRNVRVKQENQQLIIAALQAAGFHAEPSAELPSPERWLYRSYPGENWEQEVKDLQQLNAGMVGITTSASGKQAHKVINKALDRQ